MLSLWVSIGLLDQQQTASSSSPWGREKN